MNGGIIKTSNSFTSWALSRLIYHRGDLVQIYIFLSDLINCHQPRSTLSDRKTSLGVALLPLPDRWRQCQHLARVSAPRPAYKRHRRFLSSGNFGGFEFCGAPMEQGGQLRPCMHHLPWSRRTSSYQIWGRRSVRRRENTQRQSRKTTCI